MMRLNYKFVLSFIAAALACAAAQAKVVFTGYGDFQATAQGNYSIQGPTALLSSFGISPEHIETRGANINSLGLFATSDLSDNTHLAMDLTFRNIGSTAKTTTIQYAYVDSTLYDTDFQAGKITLPINYYNQNRFYPFQRPSISAPTFQSAILGLPIADIGADVNRALDVTDDTALKADLYAVNGFGPVPGSTTSFRAPSLPGGITVTNNITGQDANHRVAWGARLEYGEKASSGTSVGASYYRDQWNPSGSGVFQMAGGYAHAVYGGFDLLGEYLFLDVTADQGMVPIVGSQHWTTNGFFAELDYNGLSAWQKPVTPWVRFEDYRTHGGGPGHEGLWGAAGGVSVQLLSGLAAKAEGSYLSYRLPFQGVGDLTLAGYSILFDLVVTF